MERRVEVPVPITPARRDWFGLLDELARQIEGGRIYDRDLLDLSDALGTVLEAYRRRPYVRSGSVEHQREARARHRARRGRDRLSDDRAPGTAGQLEKRPHAG